MPDHRRHRLLAQSTLPKGAYRLPEGGYAMPPSKGVLGKNGRRTSVSSIVRDEPDIDRFARLMADLALDQARTRHNKHKKAA